MVKKITKDIIKNPWWIFSGWALAVLGFFKIDVYKIKEVLFNNMITEYPWAEAFKWILIGGAFWFGVHAYYRSTKYINERKDILDDLVWALETVSKNEADLQKISKKISRPNYRETLKNALNTKLDT